MVRPRESMPKKLPVLISIPHGGVEIPKELERKTRLNAADLFEDGDALTQKIYDLGDAVGAVLKTPIARAFVDLNRAPQERPPTYPDGVVKKHTTNGKNIFKNNVSLNDAEIRVLLDQYYFPYHDALTRLARAKNMALAIDCHSMLARAPVSSLEPGKKRPIFCVSNRGGKDGYADQNFPKLSCAPELIQKLAQCLQNAFELETDDVRINDPFHGGYITRQHGLNPLPWIRVEMNRKLYLNGPWFNSKALTVAPARIAWLKERFFDALASLMKMGR